MKNAKRSLQFSFAPFAACLSLGALLLASGCGSHSTADPAAAAGVPAATTPTDPGAAANDPNLYDGYRFNFRIAGSTTPPPGSSRPAASSQTISGIKTDNKLSVTIVAGDPSAVPGTGFTASYSCLRVQVTVLGQTQTAFVSSTGVAGTGYCQGAAPYQTLDFSNRLTSATKNATVQISQPMYDNCRLYGNPYGYGCFMTAVYWNHIVSGQVIVHTNATN